jgi:hypothetical protein
VARMVEREHADKTLVVVSESKRPFGVPRTGVGNLYMLEGRINLAVIK